MTNIEFLTDAITIIEKELEKSDNPRNFRVEDFERTGDTAVMKLKIGDKNETRNFKIREDGEVEVV